MVSAGSHHLLILPSFKKQAEALAKTVRFLAQRGWTPATSSNFSVAIPDLEDAVAISRSGVDKYAFSPEDVMVVDLEGKAVAPEDARPSAETLLHTMLYSKPDVGAVLHTHSVNGTVLSMQTKNDFLEIKGYELLKGLAGIKTHEHTEIVPIFNNTQDMEALSAEVKAYMEKHPSIHGYLIRGHGLYTWGKNLAEARRHIETFEFLFECIMRSKS